MDLDRYREDSLDAWDRFSGNWDEEHEFLWEHTRPVSERLVERLDPRPGDTVLELAAGTGDTGFLVGERVGDQGRVISTDFAPGMVEVARRRGGELGLANVEFRVLDAERMDLDDSSVDGVVARFGYMLMADPAAALAETRRVLRERGRVSFAVWAGPDQNLWAAIPGIALMERGHLPPPEPGAPGIFALADPDRIRELVTGAGFGEPQHRAGPGRLGLRRLGRALGEDAEARRSDRRGGQRARAGATGRGAHGSRRADRRAARRTRGQRGRARGRRRAMRPGGVGARREA